MVEAAGVEPAFPVLFFSFISMLAPYPQFWGPTGGLILQMITHRIQNHLEGVGFHLGVASCG
jgi:hypothetical protein